MHHTAPSRSQKYGIMVLMRVTILSITSNDFKIYITLELEVVNIPELDTLEYWHILHKENLDF